MWYWSKPIFSASLTIFLGFSIYNVYNNVLFTYNKLQRDLQTSSKQCHNLELQLMKMNNDIAVLNDSVVELTNKAKSSIHVIQEQDTTIFDYDCLVDLDVSDNEMKQK
jgi:peptidoglycan hydrolase CwlO-like protein